MKKVLAVLLAVVLCFSFASTAFAAELTQEPTATSGTITLSVKSQYFEPGNTYQLPLSIISNYTTDLTGDIALAVAFDLQVNSADSALMGKVHITGFEFADAIENRPEFVHVEDFGSNPQNPQAVSCIIPGKDILNTDRTEIGYITVVVDSDAEFKTDEEKGEDISVLIMAEPITFAPGEDFWYTDYCQEATYGKFAASVLNKGLYNACSVLCDSAEGKVEDLVDGENFLTSSAVCYKLPPVIPWTERIINLFKLWGYQIVTGLTGLLQVAQTFLNPNA